MNKIIKSIVLCTLCACIMTGCASHNYSKAKKDYESGNYAEAYELFKELGNYKNCEEYLIDCRNHMNYSQEYCNSEAKLISMDASMYALRCFIKDDSLTFPEMYYKIDFQKEVGSEPAYDGKHVAEYLIWLDGNYKPDGYALLKFDGSLEEVYFCKMDCFGDNYSDFDDSTIDYSKYIVGKWERE